jgi:hypothetical protein
MKKLFLLTSITSLLLCENMMVKINSDIATVTTKDSGHEVVIKRIQDTNNKLTDDYTKTSRACPPFCIQPMEVAKGVNNFEELEVLEFMKSQLKKQEGVIIDARLKRWFELETIPGAINIPFPVVQNAKRSKIERIFKLLGMRVQADGSWDFSEAKEMIIFDNGVWCEQAKHFIEGVLKFNYPKEKLHYYRSGFQGWKLLGLTTVVHKEIKK